MNEQKIIIWNLIFISIEWNGPLEVFFSDMRISTWWKERKEIIEIACFTCYNKLRIMAIFFFSNFYSANPKK